MELQIVTLPLNVYLCYSYNKLLTLLIYTNIQANMLYAVKIFKIPIHDIRIRWLSYNSGRGLRVQNGAQLQIFTKFQSWLISVFFKVYVSIMKKIIIHDHNQV